MPEFTIAAHCSDELGEVPIWCDRTHRVWWVDVNRAQLRCLDPTTGEVSSHATRGSRLGSIALRENGGLLLATAEGVDTFDPSTGTQTAFAAYDVLGPNQRFNDGHCDRQGRFWVGSMNETLQPDATMYCVHPDGSVTSWFSGFSVANGIAISPDDQTFYFADTRGHSLYAFEFDAASGRLGERRLMARTIGRPGRPDGSCIDAEGFLWNIEYAGGQLTRYAPDGRIDRMIPLPVSHPTAVCFGGPELDTLFITTARQALNEQQRASEPIAGALLAFNPGVRGLPEPRFAG